MYFYSVVSYLTLKMLVAYILTARSKIHGYYYSKVRV